MKQEKRVYTAQTKIDAVEQVLRVGIPASQVAKQYAMPFQTLNTWVSQAKQGKTPKAAQQVSAQEE